MKSIVNTWNRLDLVIRIIIGLVTGLILALAVPVHFKFIALLGHIFVGALRAIAPILVFFLVMSAIVQHEGGKKTNIKSILLLYLIGTLIAGLAAVVTSFIYPVKLILEEGVTSIKPPEGLMEVVKNLILNTVDNPINAMATGNYIGIITWSAIFGFALKKASSTTKTFISNISESLTLSVKWVINFAPFGVMGLVFSTITTSGVSSLKNYAGLILSLVACMFFVAFITNPLIVFFKTRKNPFPLVFTCLKKSGITAFFTRSSAANIPVNMNLCEELGLNKDTYSVSIPLGATINMSGAAVTITILTLAATNTLGITVDFPTAVMLSFVSAISACGTSGVAGGSILLVPLAASLFGIPNEIAMQVVGVGFIIGVIQDSCETALNSSTDVLFTAAAEFAENAKE